jgi:hypothetical protein
VWTTIKTRLMPGPASADRVRVEAFAAVFAEGWPDPSPEQRAEAERLILAALTAEAAWGRDVVAWARIRRVLPPELRPFDASVLTELWFSGKVWTCSVRGRWQVALGDVSDLARAARDLAGHRVTTPLAV